MHNTHDVSCKKCGKKLAFWSGYGDNMQFVNEYECQGKVFRKCKGEWQGLNSSGRKIWSGNFKPTKTYIKGEIMQNVMIVKPLTKELVFCHIENYTQFCENCAKKLKYKCPICKGKIKLTREMDR